MLNWLRLIKSKSSIDLLTNIESILNILILEQGLVFT